MRARTLFAVLSLAGVAAALNAGCGGGPDDEELNALDAEQAPSVTYEQGQDLEITADELHLLSDPVAGSTVLATLSKGTPVVAFEYSGEAGFVHVLAPDVPTLGQTGVGYVTTKYVTPTGDPPSSQPGFAAATNGASGATCDPSRGQNAVGRYQKALHDMLAYAEGTRDYSKNGYNVMYSFKLFSSCANHPNQCLKFGRTCSTAAGRYQFLTTTWNNAKRARSLPSFEPENQEKGAEYLVSTVRHVTIPQDRALTPSEFQNMLDKLSYEWASLPPGRYGQPKRAKEVLRVDYCRLAGCDGTAPATSSSSSSSGSSGASGSSGTSGTSGSSGTSGTTVDQEGCGDKTDGYYCSKIATSFAYECRGGSRVGTTSCQDPSKKCKADATTGRATIANQQLVCQ